MHEQIKTAAIQAQVEMVRRQIVRQRREEQAIALLGGFVGGVVVTVAALAAVGRRG